MNKFLTTAAIFVTLTTSAVADPVTDFFDGIFGGHSPPQQTRKRNDHRRGIQTHNSNAGDWYSSWSDRQSDRRGNSLVASFYGHGEHLSRHTASGALFNPHAMTAAHRSFPFGTVLRVCHRGCVNVTINDRGPFVRGRSLDLSYGAARAIGMGSTSSVHVERLN
jgi:rare lipoprotein A (peptidoglycan hydrolase)